MLHNYTGTMQQIFELGGGPIFGSLIFLLFNFFFFLPKRLWGARAPHSPSLCMVPEFYICTHVCMHVCMNACMYLCMNV